MQLSCLSPVSCKLLSLKYIGLSLACFGLSLVCLGLSSSLVWANESATNQTVYQGRQGDYDVSIMVDHQGQHKLSPEEESRLQAEQAKRHQQERATAEALANPKNSQDYIQPVTQDSQGQTQFDDSEKIDMILTKQNLQLAMLSSPTAPAPYTQVEIGLEHPANLKESFILAGNKLVLSYSEESGAFAIVYTLTPLSTSQQQDFYNIENLKDALTQRFKDKDNLLYGEYEILDQINFPSRKELTLRAYLKKSEDGILPEMQNYFFERTIIDKGYIATVSCEFRGSQAQALNTEIRFNTLEPLCLRILNSYSYQFKTSANQ